MTTTFDCAPFPRVRMFAKARRIGSGEFAGFYRGVVVASEALLTFGAPRFSVTRYPSATVRTCRADALADAIAAATIGAETGHVPTF